MKKVIINSLFAATVALAAMHTNIAVADEPATQAHPVGGNAPVAPASRSEELGRQLMASFLVVDEDADGTVSLRKLVEYLMARGFARAGSSAREGGDAGGNADRERRLMAEWDKRFVKLVERDAAGNIGLAQVVSGVETAVMADTESDERADDWVQATRVAMHIDRADTDADGSLSQAELVTLLPEEQGALLDRGTGAVAMNEALFWIRELPRESRDALLSALVPAPVLPVASDVRWSGPAVVSQQGTPLVSYRAAIFGRELVIEAKHAPGWHSYAIDNAARAAALGGVGAEHELPTLISLGDGIEAAGAWRQSDPKDFSKPGINWFTWGFEGTVYFARALSQLPEGDVEITINAQICNADSCAMAKDFALSVPGTANQAPFPDSPSLVPVKCFALSDEVASKVVEFIRANPGVLPSKIAESFETSEGAIIELLPRAGLVPIDIDQFDAIWAQLEQWDRPLTIIKASGSVFELEGRLLGGSYERGYFNFGADGDGIHGHVKTDNLAAIYLIKKSLRGRETWQCAFYDKAGERAFAVYVGRGESGGMDAPTAVKFEALWDAHR